MGRHQLHPIFAIAAALLVFAMVEAALVPLAELARLSSQAGDKINLFALVTALTDWGACVACVFMGMKLTRTKPVMTSSVLAGILAVWHLCMIFVLFSYAPALDDAIVPYSIVYYGGLLVTGAVLVLGYERRTVKGTQANRQALAELGRPSVYGQALTDAGLGKGVSADGQPKSSDKGLSQALSARGSRLPRTPEFSEAEERSASFFDLDLILLEDELLKIKPDRDAYISALRLAIAIEKDLGFVNCRARTFTFAELMRDVCTRLSATLGEEGEWITMAEGFRSYAQDDRLQRRTKIASYEDILIACQFKNAMRNAADAEGEKNGADHTDSGTKILAVMK
ncbi:MAG: hypothetical protein JSS86_05510 [Cyanobacteria bacterium SZAS LIN-2]|nr:hypothetical protein [Cyanobacteria bacterium SZAS LIN-3]MBS1995744.1 hypothetical protein [Cyanobacteria bacterium SZAS LIN-2]